MSKLGASRTSLNMPVGQVKLFLRSLIFLIGWTLSTIVWAPVVLAAFPISYRQRLKIAQIWALFNMWWLKLTCKTNYTITGLEHIPPGPVIVLVKHQSTWETLLLQKLFYPQAWVLKHELLWIPFFGWAVALLEPIAINRKARATALKQILRQGTKRLSNGISVIIFPEGTRVAAGKRGRYSLGGPMLAAHSGYPIVPIAHNAGEFWPRHGFIKYPGEIQVVIGPVITSQNRSPKELGELTETWIEETMQRINTKTPN